PDAAARGLDRLRRPLLPGARLRAAAETRAPGRTPADGRQRRPADARDHAAPRRDVERLVSRLEQLASGPGADPARARRGLPQRRSRSGDAREDERGPRPAARRQGPGHGRYDPEGRAPGRGLGVGDRGPAARLRRAWAGGGPAGHRPDHDRVDSRPRPRAFGAGSGLVRVRRAGRVPVLDSNRMSSTLRDSNPDEAKGRNRRHDELSDLDKRIIEHLQEDGRRPFTQIASALGVSEAAVRARTNRLVDRGILQIVGVADPDKLGFQQALIGIRCEPGKLLEVAEALASMPEVDYVVVTAGRFDVLIETVAEDNEG